MPPTISSPPITLAVIDRILMPGVNAFQDATRDEQNDLLAEYPAERLEEPRERDERGGQVVELTHPGQHRTSFVRAGELNHLCGGQSQRIFDELREDGERLGEVAACLETSHGRHEEDVDSSLKA